jgi:hypothetical protein
MYAIAECAHKRLQKAFVMKTQDTCLKNTRAALRSATCKYAALVREYQQYRVQADMKSANMSWVSHHGA